jgi:muramoyltetrapeptide carboxypeptidase
MLGIAAPASFIDKKLLRSGMEQLASWDYAVSCDQRVLERERFHAGSDLVRAQIFDALVKDPSVRAIWCARGGYGVTRILPLLEKMHTLQKLKKNPKLILGYSDITALHLWAYQTMGLKSVHAPLIATAKWLKLSSATKKNLLQILRGTLLLKEKSYTRRWPTRWLGKGKAVEGIILGGNLTLLTNFLGTRWQPQFKGALLFIEDCAEPAYRIDRMIQHLKNAGALKGVRAILVGDLVADTLPSTQKCNWKNVLAAHFPDTPVLINLPVGHGKKNEPLPLGVKARITNAGKLELLEQVVG